MRRLLIPATVLVFTACTTAPAPDPVTDPWLDGIDLAAYLDCAREQDVTLLQAHRAGDRPGAAENSIGAIEASMADGAVFIELDVAQTRDGALVLLHDRTLERTTSGRGRVSDISAEEFMALRLVDVNGRTLTEAPPTFEQAITALDGRGIAQIDLKGVDIATMAEAVRAADAVDRSIVITYSIDAAIELHRALPEVVFSVGMNEPGDLDRLARAGVDLSRVQAWLGTGNGNAPLDLLLSDRQIETSYGNFRAEREGTVNYQRLADNGAEVISVDDVPAAAAVLDARAQARELLAACPAARD
ncbi:MAG: glycerophosphodiester phosphodiesterase family protein [Pseudomonadota bacterium]